jgi:hypothetical protein
MNIADYWSPCAVRSFACAMVAAASAACAAVLGCVFDVLTRILPRIIETSPKLSKRLIEIAISRPEKIGALVTGLGALHFFRRAMLWHRRWREARRATKIAQVDAAARWVVGELRDHAARWTSISGIAQPMAVSELRSRVPHSVLSDRRLWNQVRVQSLPFLAPWRISHGASRTTCSFVRTRVCLCPSQVADRVRNDVSVRVLSPTPTAEGIMSDEGWLFFQPVNNTFGSPGSMFSSPGFGSPGFGSPGFGSPGFGSPSAPLPSVNAGCSAFTSPLAI